MLHSIAFWTYALAAGAFGLLLVLLLTAWRGRLLGGLFLAACAATVLWAGVIVAVTLGGPVPSGAVGALEASRDVAWLLFLRGALVRSERRGTGVARAIALYALIGVGLLGGGALMGLVDVPQSLAEQGLLLWFLSASVLGLAYIEQVFRGTVSTDRWRIKLLCIGLGLQFAYDFFLYAHALLLQGLDAELWAARGAVQALVVPFLALTAVRNPDWSVEIFVSRQVVFGSVAVVGAGIYLLGMSGVGYYLRVMGGDWGRIAEIGFLCGAVALLAILLTSQQLRARVKVFLTKHFFRNKYDYRITWLAFTQALSRSSSDAELRENVIRATAELIESPGGVLWSANEDGTFAPASVWGDARRPNRTLSGTDPAIRFLKASGWVIYTEEFERDPAEFDAVLASPLFEPETRPGIVVPVVHQGELIGVLGLKPPGLHRRFNWEDSDLLKTAGQQAAGYLALLRLSEALSDARQFDAFNRLSSYVVHDLKNLVAQLDLVVKNAERHLENPAFVRDAIDTVANASGKMRRLLEHLRKGRLEASSTRMVNVGQVIAKSVAARSADSPQPTVNRIDEGLIVEADAERLQNILIHLIQNAQEATPDSGTVDVNGFHIGDGVRIEVNDTGCGMDPEFISSRLFRPFETTKGNAGMGIGVYETREFVKLWGGEVEVISTVGEGTRFSILLPGSTPQGLAEAEDSLLEVAGR